MQRFNWAAILLTLLSIFTPITQGLSDILELENGSVHHGKKIMETGERILFRTEDGEELIIQKASMKALKVTDNEAPKLSSGRANSSNTHLTKPIGKGYAGASSITQEIDNKAEYMVRLNPSHGRYSYAFKKGDKLRLLTGNLLQKGPHAGAICRLRAGTIVTAEEGEGLYKYPGKDPFQYDTFYRWIKASFINLDGQRMSGYIWAGDLAPPDWAANYFRQEAARAAEERARKKVEFRTITLPAMLSCVFGFGLLFFLWIMIGSEPKSEKPLPMQDMPIQLYDLLMDKWLNPWRRK